VVLHLGGFAVSRVDLTLDWQVITGDCLDVMAEMEPGSVDAVVTDPPYGIGEARGKNKSRSKLATARDYGVAAWDDRIVGRAVIDELRRVSCEQVIFGGNYYAHILPASSSWVCWDKDNTGDFADVELAWTSHRRAARKVRWRWNGMLQQPGADRDHRQHPTQKPLGLMRWVIENYTNQGDLVLDSFCGSSTTGVACIELGRRFIGIEIDEGYADIARARIEAATRQQRLPLDAPPKPEQQELL